MQSKLNIRLYQACKRGDFDEISKLLGDGADPNCLTHEGYAPLHNAIFRSKPEGARLLLTHGANPNMPTIHEALCPAHFAIGLGEDDPLFLRLLLDAGARHDAVDRNGVNLACYCAREGSLASLKMLAEYGADLFSSDSSGTEPITYASMHGHAPCLRHLLAAGANPNVQQADGHTPATLAIRMNHMECLDILLQAGARLDLAPPKFSAFELAEKHASADIIARVRSHIDAQKLGELVPEPHGSPPKRRL